MKLSNKAVFKKKDNPREILKNDKKFKKDFYDLINNLENSDDNIKIDNIITKTNNDINVYSKNFLTSNNNKLNFNTKKYSMNDNTTITNNKENLNPDNKRLKSSNLNYFSSKNKLIKFDDFENRISLAKENTKLKEKIKNIERENKTKQQEIISKYNELIINILSDNKIPKIYNKKILSFLKNNNFITNDDNINRKLVTILKNNS